VSYNGHDTNRGGEGNMAKKNKGAMTVAGIKVPKNLQAKLRPVLKAANNPIVADLIAAGIAAAAAAIADSKAARDAARETGDELSDAADATAKQAKRTGAAVKDIAIDFARHFVDAYEAGSAGSGKAKEKKSGKAKRGGGGRASAARSN
jgi:hypothetical protein